MKSLPGAKENNDNDGGNNSNDNDSDKFRVVLIEIPSVCWVFCSSNLAFSHGGWSHGRQEEDSGETDDPPPVHDTPARMSMHTHT